MSSLKVFHGEYRREFEFMDEQDAILCATEYRRKGWDVRRDITSVVAYKNFNKFNPMWAYHIKREFYNHAGGAYDFD